MSKGKKSSGVIPARLGSTRLHRKVLREIAGRPMVEWVWRAAVASNCMSDMSSSPPTRRKSPKPAPRAAILVAMTSPECASGSDRVYEVSRQIDAEIYVNIQGDEPLLTPAHFAPLLALFSRPEVQVTTISVAVPTQPTSPTPMPSKWSQQLMAARSTSRAPLSRLTVTAQPTPATVNIWASTPTANRR